LIFTEGGSYAVFCIYLQRSNSSWFHSNEKCLNKIKIIKMAIIVKTNNPAGLLKSIKESIDKNEIRTWSYDKDGDFTHSTSSGQWVGKAWLKPHIGIGKLIFGIIPPQGIDVTWEVYGIYHGRFIEMLFTHFGGKFSDVEASGGLMTGYDRKAA
jgi:hypothetical protein